MNQSMPLRTPFWQRPATRLAVLSAALCAALCTAPIAHASGPDPYVGELMLFGGNYCPVGWLPAEGQTVRITEYELLFVLLNTTYGGDGVETFQLPDLRGRAAVGAGNGPGLAQQTLAHRGGAEAATLLPQNLPPHTHSMQASTQPATHTTPAPGRVLGTAQNGGAYASGGPSMNLQVTSAAGTGAPQPFSVRSPFLAMRWCIATTGLFPQQQ